MNTCKQQSINSFMTEVPVVQKSAIDLLCKPMDWFLYNKDLRHEGFKTLFIHHTKSLTCCNTELAFFFYLAFLSRIFTIYRQQLKEEAISLYPFYHFHPLHRQTLAGLLPQRAHISAQLVAGIEHGTFGTRSLVFLHLHWQLLLLGESLKPG